MLISHLHLALGGDEGARTPDFRLAKAALYQLSYIPLVGLTGLEPVTFPLSEECSNQLSYRPQAPRPLATEE